LDIETQRLDSAAKMIPFVSTNQLEVAGGGPGAGLFQAFSRGVDLKIVADKGTAGDTQSYFCYLVRKDLIDSGRVKTEADLRGLTFANSAPGISVDLPTARMLQKGGLTEQDLTVTYMSYPDMVSALGTQRVDVAATLEPACAQAVSEGIAVRWRTTSDYVPRQSVAMVMYSSQFAQNREAAARFMVGYLQGVRDYRKAYLEKDAALRQKLDPILAEWTGIDARVYDQMILPELHADGSLNVESIEALQDYELESGQVQERVDLSKYIDSSFREEALRRLDSR
jgi:NitT/TauT family transport system substrate-binding protein